jgi:NitT/TauT family transport system substrate-binding protein
MDFPTVVDALKAGRIQATFLLAPLAMALREQGVPVKVVYLGHRDGSEIVVKKDSPATSLADLKGKTFAIPSRFSNQNLVLRALMDKQGVTDADLKIVEMAPPDMPGALAAGQIDAYFIGEPFAAKAEMDGTGRVLYYAKDIWPRFISCVLVVREDLIQSKPEEVRDLVRGIAASGAWAETHREDAAKLVAPYYHQDEKLLRFVLTQPPDRVKYVDLKPTLEDFKVIMDAAIDAKILKGPIDLTQLIDTEFVPDKIEPADINPS